MIEIVGIVLKENSQVYYFSPSGLNLRKNVTVIVETENGLQFGQVVVPNTQKETNQVPHPLKKVIRISTKSDYQQHKRNENDAKLALTKCRSIADKYNLNMYIIDAKYNFERSQLVFRFFSDTRIDFRELAKSLANTYKTRIELRQIGVRDKAKEVGGCGICGQQLCCARFSTDFSSVSINMAKNQNIALNPSKINGVCGRLLCCLKYEDDNYTCCKNKMPKIGQLVNTQFGEGNVIAVDVLKGKYKVEIANKGIYDIEVSCGSN